MLQRITFIGSTALVYVATIGLVGYLLSPALSFAKVPKQPETPRISPTPVAAKPAVLSGKPTRIIIPDYGIDLLINDGIYADDESWTLSDTTAQFAVMTSRANDQAGNTFVYGHGTDAVFGKLNSAPPRPDMVAQLHTDNGLVFSYRFRESHSVTPDDTSILDNTNAGPPRLTIQTCTGVWNEWRTMFLFAYEKVERKV